MKRYLMLSLVGALSAIMLFAQVPSAEEIIRAVDRNMITKSSKIRSRMIVHSRRASRTMEMLSYSSGNDKSYSEYLSPPRDKGTRSQTGR